MTKKIPLIFSLFASFILFSQNTVGVITNNSGTYNGYTLFTSHKKTFLINNCGQVIQQWISEFTPGNAVYLLENGNLLRAGQTNSTDITFGGQGGVVEMYSWEGNLIWQYYYDNSQYRQHHDVFPMPNGNILILAAKVMSNAEAIQAGRNPDMLLQSVLYSEQIVEVQPVGANAANIVWEWDIKNHLVQDFDSSKDNFGIVSQSANKLDINFTNGAAGNANWLHINSVQYSEPLDQIILSSRNLSEIWIIDHSTTTAQAATGMGGLSGQGGDLLYRWGNPQAYKMGTESDRQLFGQHYPHWIEEGLLDAGKIIVFNNGNERIPVFSDVYILNPPTTTSEFYFLESNGTFGPALPDYIYADTSETPSPFNSHILSSAQRLPNGNMLICEGNTGEIFEIDAQENIVWKYINPVHTTNGGIASQGGNPPSVKTLFRATKYALDYAAFENKTLIPGNPIELNSETNVVCSILDVKEDLFNKITIAPNPTSGTIAISSENEIYNIEIYNMLGKKIINIRNSTNIDLTPYQTGIYLLRIYAGDSVYTKKVIKL